MFVGLNNLLTMFGTAMTPQERLHAMQRFDTGSMTGRWLELTGWITLALMLAALAIGIKRYIQKKNLKEKKRFIENARQLQLNDEEKDIIAAIAVLAGIKQKDLIFTLRPAFDAGLGRLMHKVFMEEQELVDRKKFYAAVLSIKGKLGFSGGQLQKAIVGRNGKERTTRHIPVGTEVKIRLLSDDINESFAAEIIQNDNFEFSLRSEVPIRCQAGDVCTIRYSDGTMIWEFEAITTACSEENISLCHSERIRYVNRRRFTRVPTNKQAKITLFPVFLQDTQSKQMDLVFEPATITEIGGPCLRVHTDLEVQIRQRVLLVIDLDGNRLLQDIGEVCDIREDGKGKGLIIELMGLHAKAIAELVRVANQIACDEPNEQVQEQQMEVVS